MSEPPIANWDRGRPTLARELIHAGRREQASSRARLLATHALAGAAVAGATGAQAATLATLKWFGLSAFVLGAGVAGWRITTPGTSDRAADAVSSVSQGSVIASDSVAVVPVASARPLSPALATPPALADAQHSSSAEPALVLQTPPVRPNVSPAEKPRGAEQPQDGRLRDELDALRTARAALTRGQPARALALLEARADGFELLPLEAAIVRVEALRASGHEGASRRLARELLRQQSTGPYAERLRALTVERQPQGVTVPSRSSQ